jgi:hypothetical protein
LHRSPSRFAVLTIAALLAWPLSARTQTLVPPPTPESHVLEAKRLLGDVAVSPTTDAGKQIATLQIDFTDFASAYLVGGPPAKATSGAVGTSGTTPPAADWRPKYAAVERDLTALIGSGQQPSPDGGVASLDPTVRKQLQDVRRNLQLFYASTLGQRGGDPAAQPTHDTAAPAAAIEPSLPPQTPAASVPDVDKGTLTALLDRMQSLVDGLTGESGKPVGTSGSLSKSGKIEVDRQSLDELRAEIAQLKMMLAK